MKAKLAYIIGNLVAAPFTWMLAHSMAEGQGMTPVWGDLAVMALLHINLCVLITLFVLPSRRPLDPRASLRHRIQAAVEEHSKTHR
jgi:hypothetical protein